VSIAPESVQVEGDGETVVLVHAGVCDSRMWDPQWEPFAAAHRVVRYDLRGFGRSPLPPEPYSHAADLVALLQGLDSGPAWLVGASLGGRIVLEAAVAHPELVAGLVLVSSALSGHPWSPDVLAFWDREDAALNAGDLDMAVEENLRMFVDGPVRGPGSADPALRGRVRTMQRDAFAVQLPAPPDADEEPLVTGLAERLGEIKAPVLVVTGTDDVADFVVIADRLAGSIPGAERATVAGAAHLPSMEQPAEFNRLVLGFLAASAGR
jgi:pimeloyl-ACP methyl ester carboxylesterase